MFLNIDGGASTKFLYVWVGAVSIYYGRKNLMESCSFNQDPSRRSKESDGGKDAII